MLNPEIVFEDKDLLVCIKPAGVPAQSDKTMSQDMVSFLKLHLVQSKEVKAGEEPYIAVVHRLDRPVGGIMVFAKTKEAAAGLSAQVQDKSMVKYYQAVLTGTLPEEEGTLDNYLIKDEKANKSRVTEKQLKGAKEAILEYEVLDVLETEEGMLSYVLIRLVTGRHHQIRCQMAHAGAGIYGDVKYNGEFMGLKSRSKEIGLYASRLEFTHPITKEHMVFKADPVGEAFDKIEAEEL